MLERLLKFSIRHRWLVLIGTLMMAALGVFNLRRLPIDAVPDITNVQVQINTAAPGYSPLEVEQRVTYPIETVMAGLPRLEQSRSLSRYGLSQITVIFEEGTNIYFARQLVNERIQEAKEKLPPGLVPTMGPIATGLGEIVMWTVDAEDGAVRPDGQPYTPTDLRTIQDWIIKPQLRTVPGVTEINSLGGFEKQFHVTPDPQKLVARGVSFHDLIEALMRNNDNRGAGYIERSGEQYLVRIPGQVKTVEEIKQIRVRTHHGLPIRIGDVADVMIGKDLRTGAAVQNGEETVLGTAFMLMGANSRVVAQDVVDRLKTVNNSLPEGVNATTVYNRMTLVDATIKTVEKNLIEGAILVIVVLFLFLGNVRAALITAFVIPLSMLFTVTGMVENEVSANLMSLGAIDFGLIVDGAVIIVENCVRRLAEAQHRLKRLLTLPERLEVAFEASKEVRKATMFGELIIMVVYIPILTLTGIEGKMFQPMAFTVVTALFGAMVLSVTFVPAAVAIFLSGRLSEKENRIVSAASHGYAPALRWSLRHRIWVIGGATLLVVASGVLAVRMGTEFIPRLDEGDITLHAMQIPGTSLTQAVDIQHALHEKIREVPEVNRVFAKIGTAEVATDPMPPNVSDVFVMLKPRDEWSDPDQSKADVVRAVEEKANAVPGSNYEFTQPIEMRFNELIAGVRADLAVKVFGDDLDVLLATAERIAGTLRGVQGAADVKVEQVSGLPVLTVQMDRPRMARYGLNTADVQEVVEAAIGGVSAGEIFEGDRRFDLVVRLPESIRTDMEALRRLPVPIDPDERNAALFASASGPGRRAYLPLGDIATFDVAPGPNQISREDGKRRVVVTANVRGRDIGSFVEAAQSAIDAEVTVPPGYWLSWGGQFEQMISAARRLRLVVPVALLLVFLLLFITFGNVKDSLLVFTGVPMALTGGVAALLLRGLPLSISAGVGFIALSGVAVLNGLVMISFINRLRSQGEPMAKAIFQGAMTRLRPVLMTALVASLGFVPMALATGRGAEVQRPLATVVIGGILSSTALTLIVLPALYGLFHRREDTTEGVEL